MRASVFVYGATMKTKSYIYILSLILILGEIISSPSVLSQTPQFRIPIVVIDSIFNADSTLKKVSRDTVQFGIHPNATYCLDKFWMTDFQDHWFYTLAGVIDSQKSKETELPPPSPSFDARLDNGGTKPRKCIDPFSLGFGVKTNIHQYISLTQTDTFKIQFQVDVDDPISKISFEWPSVLNQYCTSLRLLYITNQGIIRVNENMLTKSKWIIPDSVPYQFYSIAMVSPKVPPGPPAPVQLTSPVQDSTELPADVTLQWNAPTSAYYYRLQFATDSTFASRIFDDTLGATSKQFTELQSLKWYYWRVNVTNQYGVSLFQSSPFKFQTKNQPAGAKEESRTIPTGFSLYPNYPNPFNPSTTLRFDIEKSAMTEISIYNVLGQKVITLVSEELSPGTYSTTWNGLNAQGNTVASGVYYVRMVSHQTASQGTTKEFTALQKLLLLK